jgi:hypothetical protein
VALDRPNGIASGETVFQVSICNATRRLQANRCCSDCHKIPRLLLASFPDAGDYHDGGLVYHRSWQRMIIHDGTFQITTDTLRVVASKIH